MNLLSVKHIQQLCKELDIKPKKSKGQNFFLRPLFFEVSNPGFSFFAFHLAMNNVNMKTVQEIFSDYNPDLVTSKIFSSEIGRKYNGFRQETIFQNVIGQAQFPGNQ